MRLDKGHPPCGLEIIKCAALVNSRKRRRCELKGKNSNNHFFAYKMCLFKISIKSPTAQKLQSAFSTKILSVLMSPTRHPCVCKKTKQKGSYLSHMLLLRIVFVLIWLTDILCVCPHAVSIPKVNAFYAFCHFHVSPHR